MNIVFGGSFNPPTLAHKAIVEELKKLFKPENLIIIPTGTSYKRKALISFLHRYNMLSIMMPDVIISDIEEKNETYLGTKNTLDILSNSYDDIYFVMGADNIVDIKTWINYKELLKKYNFIIMTRDDIDISKYISLELSEYKNHFKIININYEISSTKIRGNIEKYKDLLDVNVYKYIKDNNLYEGL